MVFLFLLDWKTKIKNMVDLNWSQFTHILFFVFLSLLLVRCQAPEVQLLETATFFDLKGFLDEEKERLEKSKISLEKKIERNGKSETKIITAADFDVEFSEFYASDINRAAWLDKYAETRNENGLHYEAKEEQLEVREMDVITTKDGVTKILIIKQTENMLNDSKKELYYNSAKGYYMHNVRKSIGESETSLKIDVRFQK